jgi:hypothetical protein
MTETQQSDYLKNLVVFLVCLAIVGTLIALALYFGMVIPAQQAALHTPLNQIPIPTA